MRKLFLPTISLVLGSILIVLVMFTVSPLLSHATGDIVSPLPEFLTLQKNDQVRLLDLWKPFISSLGLYHEDLAPTAESALLYNLTEEKTLFEKNSEERLPMASLTKIMTAIVALEAYDESVLFTVRAEHLVGEDSMGLTEGEIVDLETLIYGLMLPSGNDASEVLASHLPGGREVFIKAMNDKALALGLGDTRFSNPSGLQGDGEQYTTAHDLLVMTKYALDTYPLFREIVATFQQEIPATNTHKYFFLENATNLISSYPGVKGVKTGYTPEAGLCIVTYLDYEGQRIIGVLLNSQNRRDEMRALPDFGLIEAGVVPPAST